MTFDTSGTINEHWTGVLEPGHVFRLSGTEKWFKIAEVAAPHLNNGTLVVDQGGFYHTLYLSLGDVNNGMTYRDLFSIDVLVQEKPFEDGALYRYFSYGVLGEILWRYNENNDKFRAVASLDGTFGQLDREYSLSVIRGQLKQVEIDFKGELQ